ncbi:glycogen-binding domain-containing protein [Thermodesulfobacteriota bacterium]
MAKSKPKEKVKRRKVRFSLQADNAEKVILMGDFNDWNPKKHPMKRDKNGVWYKDVILFPGTYEYKFLVDGAWRRDPANELLRLNSFGTYNNVFELTPRSK